MGRESRGKRQRRAQKAHRSESVSRRRWTLGHLIAAFVLGVLIGIALMYSAGDVEQQRATDAFGRSPGHPHYQHNHP